MCGTAESGVGLEGGGSRAKSRAAGGAPPPPLPAAPRDRPARDAAASSQNGVVGAGVGSAIKKRQSRHGAWADPPPPSSLWGVGGGVTGNVAEKKASTHASAVLGYCGVRVRIGMP